jgi:fumarylacetoacetase
MDLQGSRRVTPAFCVFACEGEGPRVGFRAGSGVVDLVGLADTVGGRSLQPWRSVFAQPYLNDFMALGKDAWSECLAVLASITANGFDSRVPVVREHDVEFKMPFVVGDFVDFYASRPHAEAAGGLMRPGAVLPGSWPYVPLGYHSRAGSVVVSGQPVQRPMGQFRVNSVDGDSDAPPVYAATKRLDFELELGYVIGTPSDGRPISAADALDHVFGVVLLNDWSARDIQAFEHKPLGPFLGKAFATSIGAWVVPLQSLLTRRVPAEAQVPAPLDHLREPNPPLVFDIDLTAAIFADGMLEPDVVCRTNSRYLYWSPEQHVVHLTSGGARLRTGDLLGTGTISGPEPHARGCMLELTENGAKPIRLSDGSERAFMNDGDEIILCGSGLGTLRSRISAAVPGQTTAVR